MSEEDSQDDEISLIDLFAVLWHRKAMIITITIIAAVGVVVFAVLSIVLPPETSPLPNAYTPKALMLINNASSSGGGMASMLSASGLGSLAGLAGVSTGATFSQLAVELVGTNTLLDMVVDEFGLITRYKIDTPKKPAKSPRADSRKALKKKLTAAYDEKSGFFSIEFTDTDPVFAQSVVNFCVTYLEKRFDELGVDKNELEKENLEKNIQNTYEEIMFWEGETRRLEQSIQMGSTSIPSFSLELNRIAMELSARRTIYTQLKVQYELLKVTMSNEKPVFQVLELAEVPDQKSGPSRGMLCIIVTFAAAFFSVFLAFVLNAVENIKKDPEAMAKFKSKKRKSV
ncbi:LPS biosynthesis protein [Spirochaetia bacterium]|nr:LPS biosynthesis protein [Spirochaetia bacterium]